MRVGENSGTQHAKEYRANDEKSETCHIWEGDKCHKEMGTDDGNQHSKITAIGSVLTCACIEEAYDIMNCLLDCKSAHSGMDADKKNQCPNGTIIGPSGNSLEKERRAMTSDKQIDDEAVANLQPCCSNLSSIPEDWQQLNLSGYIGSGYQTFDNGDLPEEERMEVGKNTTIENDLECLKSGFI
jgi:hypothetical protein